MRDRRRLLLTLLNQGVWLPYSFEYLYHDLIPTTIDSKQVKNKLKPATIYGNSVVENQLVQNGNFEDTSGWSISGATWVSNLNEAEITLGSGSIAFQFYQGITKTTNHYYLIKVKVKADTNISDMILYWGNTIATTNLSTTYKEIHIVVSNVSGNNNLNFAINTGNIVQGAKVYIKDVQLIDLTQKYPFDTPTTLTDNRIQAILNRGYIPFNTGELKSVDIGEFSSEPYNLFDGELESGGVDSSTGEPISDGRFERSKNFISVIGGLSYSLENSGEINDYQYGQRIIYQYDKNYNFIKYGLQYNSQSQFSTPFDISLSNNCKYIRIVFYYGSTPKTITNVCFHRTGTRTGYAQHTQPQTISFKYQGGGVGTSHDTMEIGKENVVFTKNFADLDLGTINWGGGSNVGRSNSYTTIPNAMLLYSGTNGLCSKYTYNIQGAVSSSIAKSIGIYGNGYCYITDSALANKTESEVKNSLVGTILEYQLATPQVITIPRKKLGVVDLGSLSWIYDSNLQVFHIDSGNWKSQGGMYCSKYLTDTDKYASNLPNKTMTNRNYYTQANLCIKDTSYTNATDFKNAMSGTYLFYETQDEVADIIDTIGVDAGGTFTANWFSWVENQLCKPSTASFTLNGITVTNNGDGSFTLNGTATSSFSCSFNNGSYDLLPIIANHTYFLFGNKVGQPNLICHNMYDNGNGTIVKQTTAEVGRSVYVYVTNGKTFNNAIYKPQVVDLTLAFGSGNEPTSINDSRIQYIINQGYIPTNTTGTYKHVDYEVLTDVDTKIKGK